MTTRPTIRVVPPAESAAGYWTLRPSLAAPGVSSGRGRGLFALGAIPAGTLIDRACTIPIAAEQCPILDRLQPLGDFYFAHPEDPTAGLLALGLMSLCNHADAPNADVLFVDGGGALGWFADLVAVADIEAGAEITYRYRCALWFSEAAGASVEAGSETTVGPTGADGPEPGRPAPSGLGSWS